jgi:hypothetical protein
MGGFEHDLSLNLYPAIKNDAPTGDNRNSGIRRADSYVKDEALGANPISSLYITTMKTTKIMSKDAPVNVFSLGMPSNANGLGRLIRLQVPHPEEEQDCEAGERRE